MLVASTNFFKLTLARAVRVACTRSIVNGAAAFQHRIAMRGIVATQTADGPLRGVVTRGGTAP